MGGKERPRRLKSPRGLLVGALDDLLDGPYAQTSQANDISIVALSGGAGKTFLVKWRRRTLARLVEAAAGRGPREWGIVEKLGDFFQHGTAKLFGVNDGDSFFVIAGHIMADADGGEFYRRAGLDPLDGVAQMTFKKISRIDREG